MWGSLVKILPLVLALLSVGGFAACSITANVYPVEGPISETSPLPVIHARVAGVLSNSGSIKLTMPDGEKCTGRWSVVAPTGRAVVNNSSSGTVSSGLDTAFVRVHGTSVVNMIKPGVNKGEAMLTGERGRVMEVVFLVGSGTASGYGAARDNRGNIYKVIL